jgi:hypothetical protein
MDTRWRRSGSETTDIWLPAKGNWLLGSMGGITAADELEAFRLGAISTPLANRAGAELQRGSGGRKTRTRAWKAEAAESAVHKGYSRVRYRFQKASSQHPAVTSKTLACHVITRRSLLSTSMLHHHSAIILKVADAARSNSAVISKTPTLPPVARQLSLKLRRRLQVTRQLSLKR